jgi:hypothetical protein
VDLVGDFVGDELFIVEGDSILLHCFSNDKLDFSEGFQLLHATYLVEKLMQKLQQRKCVFHIVFFAQNPRCCIPATAPDDIHDRYMVAREVIIQHLISVSRQSSSMFATHKFDSVESDEFTSFLAKSGVYLFLCHDGAFVEHDQTDEEEDSDEEDSSEEDSSEEDICDCNGSEDGTAAVSNDGNPEAPLIYSHEMITKIKLRMMIRWLVAHGHNIALINSLEFRDTKVCCYVHHN